MRLCRYSQQSQPFRFLVDSDIQGIYGDASALEDLTILYVIIGVRAGGARGAAAPPNFGQLRFFGQQERNWAKPVFKDVSMFFYLSIETNIFYFNLKKS